MYLIAGLLLLGGLIFGPGMWVRSVMRRYATPENRYPGNGGEFARHLLDRVGLEAVKVEETDKGDHYDPIAKAVRLSHDNFTTGSLTAITVAAHETGHAIQDFESYAPFQLRQKIVGLAVLAQKAGQLIFFALPVVMLLVRVPAVGLLMVIVAVASLGSALLVHLVTLPTEFDASFARALPMLKSGDYLKPGDLHGAEKILRAAALTYVAGALVGVLNLLRWIRLR